MNATEATPVSPEGIDVEVESLMQQLIEANIQGRMTESAIQTLITCAVIAADPATLPCCAETVAVRGRTRRAVERLRKAAGEVRR
jgi:hypothetical protein